MTCGIVGAQRRKLRRWRERRRWRRLAVSMFKAGLAAQAMAGALRNSATAWTQLRRWRAVK